MQRGWRMGAEDFPEWLAGKLARREQPSKRARERNETDEQLAERLVREGLKKAGWTNATLGKRPKADPVKVRLARANCAAKPR